MEKSIVTSAVRKRTKVVLTRSIRVRFKQSSTARDVALRWWLIEILVSGNHFVSISFTIFFKTTLNWWTSSSSSSASALQSPCLPPTRGGSSNEFVRSKSTWTGDQPVLVLGPLPSLPRPVPLLFSATLRVYCYLLPVISLSPSSSASPAFLREATTSLIDAS